MAENGASDGVVLGLDTAAWAFAPADQTSPAKAARAGALFDSTQTGERVTELRIHGVSGSDGPTMLEHPTALQVAGDTITGFYRRWNPGGGGRPSVGWNLEAYSWGGLTEQPLASASWLLLAPFMMYNLAHFMLPAEPQPQPEPDPETETETELPGWGWGHQMAHAMLRLLALAATVQFISAIATLTVSTVAWQAAGHSGALPQWMSWYADRPPGWRVAIALLSVGAVVGLLWVISTVTAKRYESRASSRSRTVPGTWRLSEPGFWKGSLLVRRQRAIHAAAALAAVALLVARPASHPLWAQRTALVFAAAVLAVAIIVIASPLSDRHKVTVASGGPENDAPIGWWCWVLLAAAIIAIVGAAAVSGWTDHSTDPQHQMFPGVSGFLLWLLIAQLALLLVFGIVVALLARRAPSPGDGFQPYLGGHLATLIALLAFLLGGLLSAALNLGVAGLLGTAVPGRLVLPPAPGNSLYVPWPVYAFGAAALGALAGVLVAAPLLYLRYRKNWKLFNGPAGTDPSAGGAAFPRVADDYGDKAADAAPGNSRKVAKAWAVGLLADDAARAVAWLVGGGLIVLLAVETTALVMAARADRLPTTVGFLHEIASIVSLVTVALAAWLVGLLRSAYSDPSKRKTIGALWDVATFWPRAAHPFAPPCYGERAVPEVVDRVLLLLGHGQAFPGQQELADQYRLRVECGPVLLTGYSQGSIIAPAVAAQLPPQALSKPGFALLTLACPARRLYGRAFPSYFGQQHLGQLRRLLTHDGREYWRNAVRRSDYIGSWIFSPPQPIRTREYLERHLDQLCWDPAILARDTEPTPPPIHRHSGWWPDPGAGEIASYLVDLLHGTPPVRGGHPPGGRPWHRGAAGRLAELRRRVSARSRTRHQR
jgi:hypothetical protein